MSAPGPGAIVSRLHSHHCALPAAAAREVPASRQFATDVRGLPCYAGGRVRSASGRALASPSPDLEALDVGSDIEAAIASAAEPEPPLVVEEEKVITTFRWPAALEGHEVSVVGTLISPAIPRVAFLWAKCRRRTSDALPMHHTGSFNEWKSAISLRRSPETADHVRSIALRPGTYQAGLSALTQVATPGASPTHWLRMYFCRFAVQI